jgi:HSP20 family molecular chaperone IbpA
MNEDEFRKEMEKFRRLMEQLFGNLGNGASLDLDDLEKMKKEGMLNDNWDIQNIDKPGVKGFIMRGSFGTNNPFQNNTDQKKLNPFNYENSREKSQEILYDLQESPDDIKIYVDLPGIKENDVELTYTIPQLEFKIENNQSAIELPSLDLDLDDLKREYKNGVLTITIPKI